MWNYLKHPAGESSEEIELAWNSLAGLTIAPVQDLLNLGSDARMNQPGRPKAIWQWRCTDEMLVTARFAWLYDLTCCSGRVSSTINPPRRRGCDES
jgi:4-alpha-glucanotransferase